MIRWSLLRCGRLVASGLGLGCLACSFLFTTGPAHQPRHPTRPPRAMPPDCSTSRLAPVIDTLIVGYQIFRTGAALAADESDYSDSPISREGDIGFGVGLALVFGISALYGYSATSRCDAARQEYLIIKTPKPPRIPSASSTPPSSPLPTTAEQPIEPAGSTVPATALPLNPNSDAGVSDSGIVTENPF
jgi:hypothetical protein